MTTTERMHIRSTNRCRIPWKAISLVILSASFTSERFANELSAGEAVSDRAPIVEVDEEVYSFEPANNGAGPMWCFGNTCVVRSGKDVFVSGLHTLQGVKPLNNCVPSLLRRGEDGWQSVYRSMERTREPSPLAVFPGDRVFLSVNPTTSPRDAYSGPSQPGILEFQASSLHRSPAVLTPQWQDEPRFTEHSYRSFAVDSKRQEMVLFQNIGYTHAEWSFRGRDDQWSSYGQLNWPRERDGTPIRICYPTVALDDSRVYLCGVSDIVEPTQEWLKYKRELTGREWDYVFRRLYYTWCDDIATGEFHDWVEIASRESTAGFLFPNDLHVHSDGTVSLLWSETAIDERLRERFFPDARQRHGLEYALVRAGKAVNRRSLIQHNEDARGMLPGRGRFHVTPDGQLWVLCYVTDEDDKGQTVNKNLLLEIRRGGGLSATSIALQKPLSSFFTNTRRAGCEASICLDVFGQDGNTMRYARIKLPQQPE